MSELSLQRAYRSEFLDQVWEREWKLKKPDRHLEVLRAAEACSAAHVDDPFAIVVESNRIFTYTCADGITLDKSFLCKYHDEDSLRRFGAQLCLGLFRLHEVQGKAHGGIRPFNIRINDNGEPSLWSVPTAQLEPREIGKNWFRAPELSRSGRATPAGDIFALGKVLLKVTATPDPVLESLQGSEYSESFRETLAGCLAPDPERRLADAKELALALDPDSPLKTISIAESSIHKLRGLQAFKDGEIEKAADHWTAAHYADPLDLTHLNNLAVIDLYGERWAESVNVLQQAYAINRFHPKVVCNIAYCLMQLGDLEAAGFWSRQASLLNPWLSLPQAVTARLALQTGNHPDALSAARSAVRLAPTSHQARLLLASAHQASGDCESARVQRDYAATLPRQTRYFDHLIKPDDLQPWGPIRRERPEGHIRQPMLTRV
ncbi:MAG: hypothetical protein KC800_12695 [Candidatus Eremiobacteraeota bacterium]|nr:hypothetical protein [Candidatus Eremiobacteraeota bacterium]